MSSNVLYGDADILVVDKPCGMLSVPDRYDPDAPVIVHDLRKSHGELLVVHRLDKDTSGVLLFARNAAAHKALSEAFQAGAVKKTYQALTRGLPDWEESDCDFPLRVDGDRLHRTIIDASRGKASSTSFRVLERFKGALSFPGAALVEARPATGRTHQIRVHLAALGLPCLCDPLYGDGKPLLLSKVKRGWRGDPHEERPLLARTALHAFAVEFLHPASGEPLRFEAEPPKDLRAAMAQLRRI